MKTKLTRFSQRFLLGLFATAWFCVPLHLEADVFYVSDTNGSNSNPGNSFDKAKKTIQAGLDACDSGDVLVVGPGTYKGTGNVNLAFNGKALQVVARDGPAATIVDGEDVASRKGFVMDNDLRGHHGNSSQRVIGFRLLRFKSHAVSRGIALRCEILSSYQSGDKTVFRNCLIKDMNYGGFYNDFINCTFYNAGYYAIRSSNAVGCIIRAQGGKILTQGTFQISQSCLEAPQDGPGNFVADPKFVNASAGDFRLQADSPCANVAIGSRIGKHLHDSDHAPGYIGAFPPLGWPSGDYHNVVTAGISLGNPPSVEVLSVQQRVNSDVIDVQYRLTDADTQQLEVRAVATTKFLDELDYWDDFIEVKTLVDGTSSNQGSGVAPSANTKTLSWNAGQDVGDTKRNLSIRILASDSVGLPLSTHWITLPAGGNDPQLKVSKFSGGISASQLRQSLLWALLRDEAERDAGLLAHTPQQLGNANGLKLWLKGDSIQQADGSAVTTWTDSSGNDHNMSGSGATFSLQGIAGEPALNFNGSGAMWVNTLDLQAPHTIAVISKGEVGSSGRLISSKNKNWAMGYISGMENRFLAGGWIVLSSDHVRSISGQMLMHVAVCDGTTATLYESGNLIGSAPSTTPIGKVALGGYAVANNDFGKGMVAEVIAFDRVLQGEELLELEGYLMEKYHYPMHVRHRKKLLYAKGGALDGKLIADAGELTQDGESWLAAKLGTRLATPAEVHRVLEGPTPDSVTKWPSYNPQGTEVNEYGFETHAFSLGGLPKATEWLEDFSNDDGKGKWRDFPYSVQNQMPADGNWSITQAGNSGSTADWNVKVTDGKLMIDNVNQQAHWQSRALNLQGKDDLYLTFRLSEDGALDQDDFVKVGYQLGNDAPVMVWDHNGSFGQVDLYHPIPPEPDLKLVLQAKNDGSEKIYLEQASVIVVDHSDLSKGFSSFFLVKE